MIAELYLAAIFLIPALVAAASITWVTVGSRSQVWWVAAYLALLFYFPNNSFGLLEKSANSNFYDRGQGTFFFSAINIFLFGLVLQTFVVRRMGKVFQVQHNLKLPALLFWVVLLGNAVVGIALDQVHWFDIFGRSGLLNVMNMMFAFYVLTSCLREPRDLDRIVNVFLFCAVTRGLWGMLRFVAMGGDPANFYANFQQISVKLTFFDINDNFVATLAAFIAGWRLVKGELSSVGARVVHLGIVLLEVAIVAFCHRRTALGGLALAAVLFALCQKPKLKYGLFVTYVMLSVPALLVSKFQRTTASVGGGSLLERLFPDVASGGQISFTTGRFAELYAAWLSLRDSPVWGLGLWGQYDAFRFSELSWHGGYFGWMHSGMLHLALKTGLIGVGIALFMFVALVRFALKARRDIPKEGRGLFMAGVAGVAFMLPNWFVGTPIIEFRTMQLIAFALALPYMAYSVSKRRVAVAETKTDDVPSSISRHWLYARRRRLAANSLVAPAPRGQAGSTSAS